MKVLIAIGIVLITILTVLNRIYIKKYKNIQKEKLKGYQMSLWGYVGEPSSNKKKELYQKYLKVHNSIIF